MRLPEFIQSHMEAIVAEWETFAATMTPASHGMSARALRDHAAQILAAIVKDVSTAQTASAQKEKSLGNAPVVPFAAQTAAQIHATLRARSGFEINQLAAEYRALRASVLRLWDKAMGVEPRNLDDVIRFNEAIDQALAESISFYSAEVDRARNLLLGMLGHDMRTPLNTIQLTASYLGALNAGADVSQASNRLINSGARMKALLEDLVDFNRTNLGVGIPVAPRQVDLADAFRNELDQIGFAHPNSEIKLEVSGNTSGCLDQRRLQQVLANLVINAIKYGDTSAPILVRLDGSGDGISFEVRNAGPEIPAEQLGSLFEPLWRAGTARDHYDGDSLGLGLFIAREIARAHGGDIAVRSAVGETVFVVMMPRERGDRG